MVFCALPAGASETVPAAADTPCAAEAADGSGEGTQTAVRLSLKDAIVLMQTAGSRAETAEINKRADIALAEGYSETYRSIDEVLAGIDRISKMESAGYPSSVIESYTGYGSSVAASAAARNAGATGLNKKITAMRRDFAKNQIGNNYQAEMNQIEYETVQVYYSVLLAEDNLDIARDNVKAKQDILKDTENMKKMGMVANKEVLAAKAALAGAESEAQAAETALEKAGMGLNFLLGYPVLSEVDLTDQLTEIQAPSVTLEDAVAGALAGRNEIKGAVFAAEVYKMLLDNVKVRYPEGSATYLNQQVAYLSARKTAADAPKKIDIDIRYQYSALADKKEALRKAKATLDYAEEGYRLTKLSYSVGMSTLADVQDMQVTRYKAGLGASAAVMDYDLAVYAFKYASSIGTSRLPL